LYGSGIHALLLLLLLVEVLGLFLKLLLQQSLKQLNFDALPSSIRLLLQVLMQQLSRQGDCQIRAWSTRGYGGRGGRRRYGGQRQRNRRI